MKELIKNGNTPMLFPYEPAEYWQNIRQIIREEIKSLFPVPGRAEVNEY